MPKAKAKPTENVATMTAYVDGGRQTVLVLAQLRGKARAFASELPRRGRRPAGAEPPARPAAERAEAWARENGAGDIVWSEPRVVQTLVGLEPLESALQAVNFELQRRA